MSVFDGTAHNICVTLPRAVSLLTVWLFSHVAPLTTLGVLKWVLRSGVGYLQDEGYPIPGPALPLLLSVKLVPFAPS
jgi:hypothetical protein